MNDSINTSPNSNVTDCISKIKHNLAQALSKFDGYQYSMPECPVVYEGNDHDYMVKLYREWDDSFLCMSKRRNEEIGRLLVQNTHADFLSHRSALPYHLNIGDYYISQNNPEFALCMYDFAYRAAFPSNFSYLRRWGALLKIAAALSTRFENREEEAIAALDVVIEESPFPPQSPSDILFYLNAITKRALFQKKTELDQGVALLQKNLAVFEKEEPSFYIFCFCAELADAFKDEDSVKKELLELAVKHSEILTRLHLVKENQDAWAFHEKEENGLFLASDIILEKLEMCKNLELFK